MHVVLLRSRLFLSYWSLETRILVHSLMGGVTTSRTSFKIARRTKGSAIPAAGCKRLSRWRPLTPNGLVGTAMRGVIDPTLSGPKCAAPGERKLIRQRLFRGGQDGPEATETHAWLRYAPIDQPFGSGEREVGRVNLQSTLQRSAHQHIRM